MKKKPLFPQTIKCPECSKTRRVDWRAAAPIPGYVDGIGVFNCLICKTINTLPIGTPDAITRYKNEVYLPGVMLSTANPDTGMGVPIETAEIDGSVIWRVRRDVLKAHLRGSSSSEDMEAGTT
jgi:hypothetical protein